MQQQMFDQFQESMLMTSRMFTSLHLDQMAVVRNELDHLRGIACELRALQDQLTGNQGKANPAPGMTDPDNVPVNNGEPETAPMAGDSGAQKGKPALGLPAAAAPIPPGKPLQANAEAPAGLCLSDAPQDVHAWLNQRISALQEERQTRWHKLLRMILGN
jgi:hypothetical protein